MLVKKKLGLCVGVYLGALVPAVTVLAESSAAGKYTYDMDRVIVSAKAPVDSTKFAGSVTVVSGEEIRASGATTVTEVLETTPGIQLVVTGRNSVKAPQVRGQDTEQVLVLVNGKRLPNTDRNIPFAPALRYNWVPVANIERIEVIRGPASSLYGADALAGVINIITREAGDEWGGSLSVFGKQTDGANGGDAEGVSVSAAGPLADNVDLSIAVESQSADAIFDDTDVLTIKSEKESQSVQADLGIDLSDEDHLKLGVLYGDEEGDDSDSSRGSTVHYPLEVKRKLGSIEYSTVLGKFDTNISLVASESDVEEGTSVWFINEDGASLDFQGNLTDKQYFSFGAHYREEAVERDDSVVFEDEIDATTFFVQDVINVGEKNTLTLGLAYDLHSKYDNEASPKINWFTQLSPVVGVKLGYGESYLAPSLRESSSAYVVNAGPTRTYVGNDDLQPEKGQTVEFGLTFKQKNYSGAVTLFRTEIEDLITTTDTVDTSGPFPVTTAEYNNVEEALLQGVEAEWSFYNESRSAKLNMSYTYLDSENRSGEYKGNRLADRAEHTVKVNYFHALPFAGIKLDAGVRYLSDQYTDTANTAEIEGHTIGDVGISKAIYKDFQLRFAVDNVGNKTVMDESAFELIEEGRSYKLTLSSTF